MKKYAPLIGIGIAALAIIGIVLFAPKANDYKSESMKVPVSTSSNSNATTTTQTAPGAYIDYSADVIANTNGTKILFFHAPW